MTAIPLLKRPHGVYWIFGPADVILYIGCSFNPESRLRDHRRVHADDWWPLVRRHEIEWFSCHREASPVEVAELRRHRPLCNPVIPEANGKHVTIPDGRRPARSLWDRCVELARARGETMTDFLIRALELEEQRLRGRAPTEGHPDG
jgi:hypothetical protein